jgi:predicted glycogen debranching enzyme
MQKTITLGRADCGLFENAIRKEWLVTNGLGGYAAGTINGLNTRRYHGMLVAALRPPLARTLLVAKIDPVAHYGTELYSLACNEYVDGTIDPHGYRYLESFHLEGLIPVWTYVLADARLEQRVWMDHGHNTTYLTYTLTRATNPVLLRLTPLCTYRDYHSHSHGRWPLNLALISGGVEIKAFAEAQPYRIVADRGEVQIGGEWYWNFKHRAESLRGLDYSEDLFIPARFISSLEPGETMTLICSVEAVEPHCGLEALEAEQQRQARLLKQFPAGEPAWIRHLALAADQFIVKRPLAAKSEAEPPEMGATVLAGYPWFSDWGRDTMAALPGLTLATKRPDVAECILRTFAGYVNQGMLPNRFPDTGQEPEYNTADAALWYIQAIYQYTRHTGSLRLVRELYPTLIDIITWHEQGARYGIRVDPKDGLLFAGEPGLQLTWMDAKVGDWVVTPRIGKAVEVNALWYNALRSMADFSRRLGKRQAAKRFNNQADFVAANFQKRFWYEAGGYLCDVIDGPGGTSRHDGKRYDCRLRPNQLLAVSLPFNLLTEAQAKAVVDVCARYLWTSYGLRTLAAIDPAYTGYYGGSQLQRDSAYHQGTVWAWLIGPFVTAHYRAYGDAALARSFLTAIEHHLADACLGSINEIFDGDPPHSPHGCFAQALSVAELLRAWSDLAN